MSIMWLIGVLVTYLVSVKPSTAELGLPISFLGAQDKIYSLIDNARPNDGEPFNKTLQELAAISLPFDGSHFVPMRRQWLDAMVKLSWIQNYTLTNVTKAIDDRTSGHRKVLDILYGNIKNSKQQLVTNRGLIGHFNELSGGTRNIQLLKDIRAELEDGLDHLQDALKALDDAISKAQLETPLTESSIGKVVTPGMTTAVWSAVVKILGSIKPLVTLANGLLVASKLARQDATQTRSELFKMIDWKDADALVNATRVAATKIQITTAKLMQNLNQTAWTAYKSLAGNKLVLGASTIDSFLANFTQSVILLNVSITTNAQYIFAYTLYSVISFQRFVESRINWAADYLGLQVFANANYHSLAENCLQKYPHVNATVGKVFQMFNSCIVKQMQYLPNIIKMIEEFFQPFRVAVMAPLADLQTCTASKVDPNLCLGTFATTHSFESSGVTSNRTLSASISNILKQAKKVVENEFVELETRFQKCTMKNVALSSMDQLLKQRDDCIGIEY